jgi:hypothetical protein
MSDQDETKPEPSAFDFSAFPPNTLFHERRERLDRRDHAPAKPHVEKVDGPRIAPERRAKKERRRRIDPTTFEKQYTDDELEFMNAMQQFKVHSGKLFPTCGDALKVAIALGYRKSVPDDSDDPDLDPDSDTDDLAEVSTLFEQE